MANLIDGDLNKAQQLAKTAQVFAWIALTMIGLTILLNSGLTALDIVLSEEISWRTKVNEIGLIAVQILPAVWLCEAINRMNMALKHYCEGDFFNKIASQRVAEAGEYATMAMFALILIVPNLTQWIRHNGGFEMRVEPEYLGMLAFAIFIVMVGRILSAATTLKEDNEGFV
tara:strand:- start:7513 stop:8028 length:516 start_codon:yes stop_codon:yes gene_type:complete